MEQRLKDFLDRTADLGSSCEQEVVRERLWCVFSGKEDMQEELRNNAETAYEMLLEKGLPQSPYLKAAALYIGAEQELSSFDACIRKMTLLYQQIEKNSKSEQRESCCGAALLAASGITVPEYQQRTKRIKELLRNWMMKDTGLPNAVNLVLLFHTDDIALCERVIGLCRAFSEGQNLRSQDCSLLLGLLALSREKPGKTAERIAEATEYLKEKKDFFSEDEKGRLATAVCAYLVTENEKGEAGSLSQVTLRSMKGEFRSAAATAWSCCF